MEVGVGVAVGLRVMKGARRNSWEPPLLQSCGRGAGTREPQGVQAGRAHASQGRLGVPAQG